ncbi:MAG: hypothetical protein ACRYG2_36350 [Janthinobacterium lividum]
MTIASPGTSPAASFTLVAGTCTQTGTVTGGAADLCTQLGIVVTRTVGPPRPSRPRSPRPTRR